MPPDNQTDPTDIEAEARAEGWVPEAEWKGEPPKHGFLSAEEFVERGKTVIPILNSKLKERDGELESLRAELTGIKETAQRFEQFSQRAIEREKAERQRVEAQLEAARAQAITDGDGTAAVQAERALNELRQAPTPQAPPPPALAEQDANAWVAKNPWFGEDEVMRKWAESHSRELLGRGIAKPGLDVLNRVAEDVKRAFPDRFQSAPQSRISSVEGAGRRQAPSGRRTFDDLPQEAKTQFDAFNKMGVKMTKQQYIDQYDWSGE